MKRAAPPALLAALVLLAFLPVPGNGFTNWDDVENFLENPNYRGLSPDHLHWMFTTSRLGHYHPLTWMSLGLDYLLWGMDGRGYHLTSLLLHATSAILLYFTLLGLIDARARGARFAAWAGAALFALHPLRVESVAWASERRDVLCGLFFFLTLLAYLRMAREQARGGPWKGWLALSTVLFACSLLSKALAIMLPFVLLVLDVHPLRRFQPGTRGRILLEKLPFLLVAFIDGLLMLAAMRSIHAVRTAGEFAPAERVMQAAYGLCFYPLKTLAPVGLSPLYSIEHGFDPWQPRFLACLAAVLGATAACLVHARRRPAAAAAWIAYAVLLFPVLGLVVTGPQITADRYTYLACLPLSALVAGGLLRLGAPRPPVLAAVLSVFAVLGGLTFRQCLYWKDSLTLWNRVIELDPNLPRAYSQRGMARAELGDPRGALEDLDRAVQLGPRLGEAWNNRGILKAQGGDPRGAIPDFDRALALSPGDAQTLSNRGLARAAAGDPGGALADFTRALESDPGSVEALNNRALAHSARGDFGAAVRDYTELIRLQPAFSQAYNDRGNARAAAGDPRGALADYDRALELGPRRPRTLNNRSSARLATGDAAGAVADATEALRLDPGLLEALLNRGLAHERRGDRAAARTDYEAALRQAPPAWPNRPAAQGLLEKLK